MKTPTDRHLVVLRAAKERPLYRDCVGWVVRILGGKYRRMNKHYVADCTKWGWLQWDMEDFCYKLTADGEEAMRCTD